MANLRIGNYHWMLKKLHIQNYAIIDEIEIEFSSGLNIITGETGAGKSILMGALSLILGDRVDTSVLLNRDKKCFIEGIFTADNKYEAKRFLQENELNNSDEEIIIRREVSVNGKSRAFVNDTPVNLDQLRQLSGMLVDLHRQFGALELGESDFQREIIDALANNSNLLACYQGIYFQWQDSKSELAELLKQKNLFTKEFDYNKFLFDELEQAGFKENELEDAEAELKLLDNSEAIKNAVARVIDELNEGEHPLVQQLKVLSNQLQNYSEYHSLLTSLVQRLHSVQIELQDIGAELERFNDQIIYDADRTEELNERISVGYRLMKKHGVNSTSALLQQKTDLEEKLQAILNIDEVIGSREMAVQQLLMKAEELAGKLSLERNKQVKPFEKKVNQLLIQVGMPNARLRVETHNYASQNNYEETHNYVSLREDGKDNIEFLFDANKSNRFEPVRKIASGGELSRLMLCIKSLVAQSIDLPTLIFDEIDSGISGEAARQVGIIMKTLAKQRQVIAITHQPQIAGKADAHFFVYKEIQEDKIKTNIRILSEEERITTVAKMLSGEKPTAAALENAREMIMN